MSAWSPSSQAVRHDRITRPRKHIRRGVAGSPKCRMNEPHIDRRRLQVAGVLVTGSGLLGASLSTRPGSWRFYPLTFGVAATWIIGGIWTRPPRPAEKDDDPDGPLAAVLGPVAIGAAAFGVFYLAALAARRVPILDRALIAVMRYVHRNSGPLVLSTALANAVGEEIFFRGSVYGAVGANRPGLASTVVYMMATAATRNPSLVLASGAMGTVFAAERNLSGGVRGPILTHLTWSALMLRYLPPLFRSPAPG